jgi:hypothetical protein
MREQVFQEPDAKDMQFLVLAEVAGAWLVTGNLRYFRRKFGKKSGCSRQQIIWLISCKTWINGS